MFAKCRQVQKHAFKSKNCFCPCYAATDLNKLEADCPAMSFVFADLNKLVADCPAMSFVFADF